MTNLIWSIVLAIVGIAGIYLAGSKKTLGWILGLSAQVLWIIFALVTAQYGFILSAVAYGIVYGRNWYKWSRQTTHIHVQTVSPTVSVTNYNSQQSVSTATPSQITHIHDLPVPKKAHS